MRIITRDALLNSPAGTIYSHVEVGKYAAGIYRKGETELDGWWKRELLPQRTLGRALPWFQPVTWCPREGFEVDEAIFVYDEADVAHLVTSFREDVRPDEA